jgi:hypothetical protein
MGLSNFGVEPDAAALQARAPAPSLMLDLTFQTDLRVS